jgi:hypothetical protein
LVSEHGGTGWSPEFLSLIRSSLELGKFCHRISALSQVEYEAEKAVRVGIQALNRNFSILTDG